MLVFIAWEGALRYGGRAYSSPPCPHPAQICPLYPKMPCHQPVAKLPQGAFIAYPLALQAHADCC